MCESSSLGREVSRGDSRIQSREKERVRPALERLAARMTDSPLKRQGRSSTLSSDGDRGSMRGPRGVDDGSMMGP
jgi:hypothetical protein